MDKGSRAKELYGYAACLVALITFLVSTGLLVRSVINLSNPLYAEDGFGTVLSSFEGYVATYRNPSSPFGQAATLPPDTASAETLRARWEALRADRIARVRFEATRSILTNAVLIMICIMLFRFHWRWLRSLKTSEAAA